MLYWDKYCGHEKRTMGKKNKFDNNIYSFDIETTSFLILNGEMIPANQYLKLSDDEQSDALKYACMYIWMFSINDIVYYGRTWDELKCFLHKLDECIPERKFVFVHNLAFEFQFLKSVFHFEEVTARKSHKVMTALMQDYNILLKCSYMMSNCALKYLPDLFNLPVQKMVGDLDYSKIRTSITPLTEKELGYCEHDCLVVYHYILFELESYEDVKHIPTTSTGHVRRELQQLVMTDFKYRRLVNKAININPHVFNLLHEAFMGGYTHSSYAYTDEILHNVDSYDETSAYPYCLVAFKFPSSEFRFCQIKKREDMSKRFCYLLVVKFKNIKCKYINHFISESKCRDISGAKYDNGRIIEAKELTMTLTDIDFYFILDTYKCSYEILESYYSNKNYLPKQFINFVLDKYENKTKYKDVEEKKLDYQKEKNKFNALYGMSVTNTIRDDVIYNDDTGEWIEKELTNDEIEEKLIAEKKKSFLSFAYGVWVTAYARDNLLRRVIELDDYIAYCDTDSAKLIEGYDKDVFIKYNESVKEKIKFASESLGIDINRFQPEDIHGNKHLLGVFEYEGQYEEFITQGAKKYAVTKWMKNSKLKGGENIIERGEEKSKVLEITVAGVPKSGALALKNLDDFRDDFVFDFETTNKNLLVYSENQEKVEITDYLGNNYIVSDKSGCCLLPTTYILGKALEYTELLTDESSHYAIYKE